MLEKHKEEKVKNHLGNIYRGTTKDFRRIMDIAMSKPFVYDEQIMAGIFNVVNLAGGPITMLLNKAWKVKSKLHYLPEHIAQDSAKQ